MDMTWDTIYFSVFSWKLDLKLERILVDILTCVWFIFFLSVRKVTSVFSEDLHLFWTSFTSKGVKEKKQASCILTPCFPSTMVTMSPHTMGGLTDPLLPTIMGDTCPPPGTTTQWLDHLSPTPRTWDPEWTPPAMYSPVSLVTSSSNGEC